MSRLKTAINLSRRHFFGECGVGVGKIALAGLLTQLGVRRARATNVATSLVQKPSHYAPKAKAVIHLFMAGAPSQLEMFDYKPKLAELEGKPIPPSVIMGQRYAFIRPDAGVLGPRFKFAKHGQCGAELSEALTHLATVADDVAIVRSMHTDQFNHAPAQLFLNTGFSQPGRPSLGSWALYGLGCETDNLPAFIVMSTGSGVSGGSANWSSGFLPTVYGGVRFRNSGDPILHVSNPPGVDDRLQRDSLDLVRTLNERRMVVDADPEIAARIASYEMAFRLQASAPELTDLKSESQQTLEMYGCNPDQPSFARACLLARRMVERGVRFINIYHEGWDGHTNVAGNVKGNCADTDKATAALVKDLKQRGLLDETLVIWGGEFGRTPMVEADISRKTKLGRDHHPQAFTAWMAGGGVKAGTTLGATDEFGFNVVEDPVHIHDLQATVLHLLGLDHTQLTYRYQGRDFRLTDVHGRVVEKLLA